tara:strand:- start:9126 stop:10043 length:918 start_codon:yes stop_codon:yes gene_type:complete
MKIVVMGNTGFIGQNLFKRLIEEGHTVIGCSRSTGVDATVYEQLKDFIQKHDPDIIFNVASHGGSMRYVRKFAADVISDNVQMVLNLYRAVKKVNPKIKIIQPFSNCSYPGDSGVQHEEDWLVGDVHKSVFSFGNSKRTIFFISKCYYEQYGINTVNLIFPNTYGPGDSTDPNHTHALNGMVIRMMKAKRAGEKEFVVWGTGKPVREWAYVDDFIQALVRGIELDNVIYPLNIGQECGYSIAESATMIREEMGYEGEIVFDPSFPDGDPIKILGSKKLKDNFPDFEFFDHRKGIAETIRFYEKKL